MQLLGELSPEFCELARTDSLPYAFHGVKEERQIMMGQEDAGEHLARLVKVAKKSPCVAPADRTTAGFIQRILVQSITGILDIQLAARGERLSIAPVARRQHAIKHVNAPRHRFD